MGNGVHIFPAIRITVMTQSMKQAQSGISPSSHILTPYYHAVLGDYTVPKTIEGKNCIGNNHGYLM